MHQLLIPPTHPPTHAFLPHPCCACQPEMIVLDPGEVTRVVRQPKEVQRERQAEAEAANAARAAAQRADNEDKTKMKVGGWVAGWGVG